MVMENYITGAGQKLLVHNKEDCKGANCVIHHPSVHALSSAPTYWRADRHLMERICPHGVGHPDPDDIAYTMLATGGRALKWGHSVHGCDGCCAGTGEVKDYDGLGNPEVPPLGGE